MKVLMIIFCALFVQVAFGDYSSSSEDDSRGKNADNNIVDGTSGEEQVQNKETDTKITIRATPMTTVAKARNGFVHQPQPVYSISHVGLTANEGILRTPYVQPQVSHLGAPMPHVDVMPMSEGTWAVAVDNLQGGLVEYLQIGEQINLIPHQVYHGLMEYVLPVTDFVDGHHSLVHVGNPTGHLTLLDVRVGNSLITGIQGYDDLGEIILPVTTRGNKLYVEPTVYRTNLNGNPSDQVFSNELARSIYFAHV